MTLAEQRERNFKLSKLVIDYYGQSFFKGKKILDLGSGNGEFANIFAKLGAHMTCCDARDTNLALISKKYPHITTVRADLETEFPFLDVSFDLVFSIDLLCHIKNYEFHLSNLLNVAERIVLETEVLDSADVDQRIAMQESTGVDDLSFSGEGSIVPAQTIHNKLSVLGAKPKRIDETKLNDGHLKYDWKQSNSGRKPSNRRFWFISKDHSFTRMIRHKQALVEQSAQQADMQHREALKASVVLSSERARGSVRIPDLSSKDKKFVMVIPSYKNEKWCEKNILSALNQRFDRFRIIFTDDCSPDKTFDIVERIVGAHPNRDKCVLIRNKERVGAMKNLYDMIRSCDDDEICLTLDGDDWLPDDTVLIRLQNYYNTNDIWISYGQYANSTDGGVGIAAKYPDQIIANNSFRSHPWGASHLRSFYAWLFKRVKKEDFMYQGAFFESAWDLCLMWCMMEQAGFRQMHIPEVLYIYNMDNPISDHRKDLKLQQFLDGYIRRMPRYSRIEPAPPAKKVGLLIIATNKYDQFLQPMIDSADKHFMNNEDVSYYIFTDSKKEIKTSRNTHIIPIKHKPFPYASMDRFSHFVNNKELLSKEEYLFYCDVDSLFVDDVGREILGELVGVRHCGYINKVGPYETNINSKTYVDVRKAKHYYGGGLSGGISEKYLKLSESCKEFIDIDASNGIIPLHHDETAINRYFIDNEPTVILNPDYHFPQSNLDHYKKIWGNESYKAKILLLDKEHLEIRK